MIARKPKAAPSNILDNRERRYNRRICDKVHLITPNLRRGRRGDTTSAAARERVALRARVYYSPPRVARLEGETLASFTDRLCFCSTRDAARRADATVTRRSLSNRRRQRTGLEGAQNICRRCVGAGGQVQGAGSNLRYLTRRSTRR